MAELPFISTDPDWLFTVTINLMWQLHDAAGEQHVAWAADDLLVAISELDLGPWRHLGSSIEVTGLPFTMTCTLLDRLLVGGSSSQSGLRRTGSSRQSQGLAGP